MDTKEINKIPIPTFLNAISVYPERKCNGYWMYKSLVNSNQRTGSLKVSANNLWIDYSLNNTGGTLIDLILLIYPEMTVKDIVKRFNSRSFSFHQPNDLIAIEKKDWKEDIVILNEYDIYKKSYLSDYLKNDRGINGLETCNKYLKTIHYKSIVSNKEFWNLGCRNFNGGLNMFFKGFKRATRQGFTLFENPNTLSRIYFESIIDFLSFLMLYPEQELHHDYCILNTVNNLKMTFENLPFKRGTESIQIIGFLDRDAAGDKATALLKTMAGDHGAKFYDYRTKFKGKDLNDYLMGKY